MKDLERRDSLQAQAIAKSISNLADELLYDLSSLHFNRAETRVEAIKRDVETLGEIFKKSSGK